MKYTVNDIVTKLASIETEEHLFNPYNQVDKVCDQNTAPGLRQNNLRIYLNRYLDVKVSEMWITEHGGSTTTKLSGIPLIAPAHFQEIQELLNLSEILENPVKNSFFHSTETKLHAVWQEIAGNENVSMIWNALPFCPNDTEECVVGSNPYNSALVKYSELLKIIIDIYKPKKIIALNERAAKNLKLLNINPHLQLDF